MRRLAAALLGVVLLAGCATGDDAVDVADGGEFRFVQGTPSGEVIPEGERASAPQFAGKDVTHLVSSPLERAQQTMRPLAETTGLDVRIDDRIIEAGNAFEGMKVGGGAGVFRAPRNWWKLRNPFQPSWGEPYVEIAARMIAAVEAARDAARGHAAVLVSHQLPIWTVRLHVEARRYLHDPRRRQCGLASVTSLTYDGDRFVGLTYAEPAGATDPDAVPGA